ncbi:MAG: hypothetical protein ACRDVP_03340 [Acidimicrobiales bacterium]
MTLAPEIASVLTTLEELSKRVSSLADAAVADDRDEATELVAVERALLGASRRLRRLVHP